MSVPVPSSEFLGTGRRKEAVARVRIRRGAGKITINERPVADYCPQDIFAQQAFGPIRLVEMDGMLDVRVLVDGGGTMGQAGAIAHGIARALVAMRPEMRPALKREGMLTRDSRMKERKKSGQPGARKRFQFSKR
ncbi:MAG: 30S ribosomal protein S9 [Puniceicoccales bacterium]|jgi:small subunit ribosomal protein S9|nr:30S ribosomal protein S9 [Puniceicoccales bacterium]